MADDSDEQQQSYDDFSDLVNMTATELEKWLDTDESRSVGQKSGGGESTGHEMGRTIVGLLRAKRGDLSDDDYAAMKKVVGYCKRHVAQKPSGDVEDSKWRYSLMNWGHDRGRRRGVGGRSRTCTGRVVGTTRRKSVGRPRREAAGVDDQQMRDNLTSDHRIDPGRPPLGRNTSGADAAATR